jgi:hypothetical protein
MDEALADANMESRSDCARAVLGVGGVGSLTGEPAPVSAANKESTLICDVDLGGFGGGDNFAKSLSRCVLSAFGGEGSVGTLGCFKRDQDVLERTTIEGWGSG